MAGLVDLEYESVAAETEAARLIEFGDNQEWIPKSVSGEVFDDIIEVREWFVIENELDGYVRD